MHITKPANLDKLKKTRTYVGRCHRCECEFECDKDEVKTCHDPRDNWSEEWVECPTPDCKAQVSVNLKK